jgi:biotin carboxylase
MKSILLLGGSKQQIPAIEYANKQGYRTILCDYLTDNPGQEYADVHYLISTTDREAIFEIAKKENVDGIIAYASDPAAPIAAYVAEQLNLPTNPFKSVEILSYKDKFREFLTNHDFPCPHAESFCDANEAKKSIGRFKLPVMVKPVDGSGSKGVNKVNSIDEIDHYIQLAFAQSRQKVIIIEGFIEQDHPYIIAGDCFVINGRVEFWGFLNSHRDSACNIYVPTGTSYPIRIEETRLTQVKETIQRLFDCLDIRFGAFNMEVMINQQGEIYIIEMGPRNGGNMIPDLLKEATGNDMIAASIQLAMGNEFGFENSPVEDKCIATHVLHARKQGVFKQVNYNEVIKSKLYKEVLYKSPGDEVTGFDGANKAIGIIFMSFESRDEMFDILEQLHLLIQVELE